MKIASRFLALVVAIVLAGGQQPGVAQTANTVVIRVAGTPIDSAAEPYYAQEMGFFKRLGLNVQIQSYNNGAAIAAGVAAGAIDVGVSNAIPLALAHERGVPFVILFPSAVYDPAAPTTLLMVAKTSSIRTAKDLDGKTIATQALQSLAQLTPEAWIDGNGGNAKAVRFVEMASSELPNALEQGRVDAIVAIEPSVALAKPNARVLVDPYRPFGKGFVINVWFTTREWADAHPEQVAKLVEAMRLTALWANAHQRESAVILEKYAKVSPETVQQMVRAKYGDRLDADAIQPNIDIAARYGLLQKKFPAADIIYRK